VVAWKGEGLKLPFAAELLWPRFRKDCKVERGEKAAHTVQFRVSGGVGEEGVVWGLHTNMHTQWMLRTHARL